MIDLNAADPFRKFDLQRLSDALADRAFSWVPGAFPAGQRINGELRLADISGRAPRKSGSCVIELKGEHAGEWYDHATAEGGGPLSTLGHATGLSGVELWVHAEGICGGDYREAQRTRLPARRDHTAEIAFIRGRCRSLKGTLGETYLEARGLADPGSPDLLYCDDVTDWDAGRGRPAMIAILRNPDGTESGGIFRTFLADDGTAKADMPKPKLGLGPCKGASVRLKPVEAGKRLGIAEGIETALAASALFRVPVWAAIGTENMRVFEPPAGMRQVVIFRDAGKAGADAAEACRQHLAAKGIEALVELPRYGDDFADDLAHGETQYELAHEIIEPESVLTLAGVTALVCALTRDSEPGEISAALKGIGALGLDEVGTKRLLGQIKRATGISVASLEKALRQITRSQSAPSGSWTRSLALGDNGLPKPILSNASAYLEHAGWSGAIGYDEFAMRVMRLRTPAGDPCEAPWTDVDTIGLTVEIQRAGIDVPRPIVDDAVQMEARRHAYHPVRDYLDRLVWDRTERIDRWLTYYCGVEDGAFTRAAGAKWLIAAVARIQRPGTKFDHMLVLEGVEGKLKSTVFATLGGEWFSDRLADPNDRKTYLELHGKWLIESAELDGIRRADARTLKAFLSRTTDHYVPPYGHYAIDAPRQCVFAGTTNEHEYLLDAGGNRRFWCFAIGDEIDIETLRQDRDQLWAEATARYRDGEHLWIEDEEALAEAHEAVDQRTEVDPWTDKVAEWASGLLRDTFTLGDVLGDALGIPKERWDRGSSIRTGNILRKLGYGWRREGARGNRARNYYRIVK